MNVNESGQVQTTQTSSTIKQTLSTGVTGNTPSPPQICGTANGIGAGTTVLGGSTSTSQVTFDDVDGDSNNLSVCSK